MPRRRIGIIIFLPCIFALGVSTLRRVTLSYGGRERGAAGYRGRLARSRACLCLCVFVSVCVRVCVFMCARLYSGTRVEVDTGK